MSENRACMNSDEFVAIARTTIIESEFLLPNWFKWSWHNCVYHLNEFRLIFALNKKKKTQILWSIAYSIFFKNLKAILEVSGVKAGHMHVWICYFHFKKEISLWYIMKNESRKKKNTN